MLATTRSAAPCLAATSRAGLLAQERDLGRHALLDRGLGHVRRGLDAERADAPFDDVLQEVAVVARHLDDEGAGVQRQPVDGVLHEGLGVRDPGVAVGGEVGVVAEDVLGGDVGGQLDQQAPGADPDVQGVEDLAAVELVGGQVALAGRRHPQVDEGVDQLAPQSRQCGALML